ncbi:MFS transporter [Verminephrobacter aporrectodeae subsp. tuberculatae]|uniref:organoarsenical effux MFS transporter ArsJ n=1 Tax=Verminephrobacter aporrectodeae TaxID=1110389 RepID=UPI0002DDA376|nr:organoarsenical effux MFS transporter ArsJ [Verminephrobacter aporrectodeae]MCW8166198.1 MFS transporter [Verminephrobacter aporrectodeae subsp. tuberculatae]MCW8170182.1 MFS transporter [Verminephrobacter aporrectodeae subsp. tuberculatae]MCW8206540.1 MFS transporter [Verminephrobacter aporrectodeae subsp. tuberculatae]
MQGHATRNYAIVTAAYWGFTLTDGALRMLVLLHFYRLGYSPFALAFLFLLYEAAGVLANLIGGWLATRHGITRMLTVGLLTQIIGFALLSRLDSAWSDAMSVVWVVLAQGICGVAKDLTKTASKSAIKLTSAEAKQQVAGQLFKWVAWFTGSKNAMKGVGFFLGGLLLQALGFRLALWAMIALLALVLLGVVTSLPRMMGKSKASRSAKELFAKNAGINALAAARVVLFGARDVWFVVGVPVFLYSQGWTFTMVGGFLAAWTIGYGLVQALAPKIVKRSPDGLSEEVPAARLWSAILALVPIAIAVALVLQAPYLEWVVVGGLGLFGFAFAVNSSVHSYLVLAYAGSQKTAEDVGFYYAANALGRFFGTLMSGLLYQWGGLIYALGGSAVMLLICWLITLALPVSVDKKTPAVV